jgi:FkbM family methyltransferase
VTRFALSLARLIWRYPRRIGMHLWPRRPVHTRGLTFTLPCDNDTTYARWRSYNQKEPETLDWIDRTMRDSDVLFDVGANIGVYTLYAAFRHPHCRVIALEPEYSNLHLLRDNVVDNALTGRVSIYAVAVSDRTRLSYLHVQNLTPGAALHFEAHKTGAGAAVAEGVFSQSLDDFCAETGLQPNCIKVDVDGNEAKVLAGAAATLRHPALRSLLIELPEDAAERAACEAQLTSAGFTAAWRTSAAGNGNSIWLRKDAA